MSYRLKEADGNPPANRLGVGLTAEQLKAAIEGSGHPLQASVASVLRDRLSKLALARWAHVEEERTYEDPESGTVRAADALAEAALWEFGRRGENPRIRPTLNLIVECKQSELPYVFFTRQEAGVGDFAVTSGFPHNTITLTTNDDPSTYTFDIRTLLGVRRDAFTKACPIAVSMSKVRRKGGKNLEVSGEDAFNALHSRSSRLAIDSRKRRSGAAPTSQTGVFCFPSQCFALRWSV